MNEPIANRIKRYRLAAGLTQAEVGNAVGVSRVAVGKWESGQTKDMKRENLLGMAKLFKCSLEELLSGVDYIEGEFTRMTPVPAVSHQINSPIIEWSRPEDLPLDQYVIVPRYDLHVAAGNGHVVYDELELDQGKAYRTDYIRAEGFYARNLLCLRALGDSMEPSIKSGDTLLIDRSQNQVQDRNVYVLRYGNEIRVKRLYRRPDGGLRIVSDNPLYPEEIITSADMHHIEIIGRVVERSGRM